MYKSDLFMLVWVINEREEKVHRPVDMPLYRENVQH
jgi:hypothetical protein